MKQSLLAFLRTAAALYAGDPATGGGARPRTFHGARFRFGHACAFGRDNPNQRRVSPRQLLKLGFMKAGFTPAPLLITFQNGSFLPHRQQKQK